ncbi:hypothetical protein Trisim1_008747 [Trichoderma cf. simile WF8]
MAPSQQCAPSADNVFGPQVHGCREDFDFTLLFEQSILSILPSLIFLLLALSRCFLVWKRPTLLRQPLDVLLCSKMLAFLGFGATQIALIIQYAVSDRAFTKVSIAASAISLVTLLPSAILSYLDHHRSIRPSTLLCSFLALATLFDVSQARTLWLRHDGSPLPATFTAAVAFRFCMLLLESVEKRSLLKEVYRSYSPEALGSIFNRSVFWWLNRLLLRGSASVLRQEDLMSLDPQLLPSSANPSDFGSAWAKANKDTSHALFKTTITFFLKQFLPIFLPRVFLIGFNIAQPLLIYRAVSLLAENQSQDRQNAGHGMIGATILVYLGIALSTGLYKRQTYRCMTMIRSALVSLIYETTLQVRLTAATDKAALTLMSTDIDQIASGLENLDVVWASPIEIALAIYILVEEISLAALAPVVVVIACTASAFGLSIFAPKYQIAWVGAIQARVATTASMLGNMKGIRMSGLTSKYTSTIHNARVTELHKSLPFRRILVAANVFGTISRSIAPVGAFVMYSLLRHTRFGNTVDPATVFSSLALLTLVAQPLMQLMFVLPMILGSLGCFARIEKYLLSRSQPKNTETLAEIVSLEHSADSKSGFQSIELDELSSSKHLISLRDATFCFDDESDAVLRNLSASVPQASLIMVTGPVGCGKSALLLAMLGEMTLAHGSVDRRPHLRSSYCAQETWLPNMSIRKIILGPSEFNASWYREVIHACALEQDLASLVEGDETAVGAGGIMLSGGQKQRVGLARALYAKPQLILLDDITSGLDATTEQAVVQRVLGADGLCRTYDMSVLLSTHKTHFMHIMDRIWSLNQDGSLCEIADPPAQTENSAENLISMHSATREDDEGAEPSASVSAKPTPQDDNDSARQQGDLSLYLYYLKAMGWKLATSVLISAIGFAFMATFPSVWLSWWSDSELKHPGAHQAKYLGVYAALGVAAVLFHTLLLWTSLIEAVPVTSIKLHKLLLDKVMSAPLSFFVTTDTGVTVNRFSQDMSLLDNRLPAAMVQTLDGIFLTVATIIVIAVTSKYTAISFPILLAILYILQKFYLRTSRQMRLLDLESKSALYTNFLETLQGIATVRAFGWQDYFRDLNRGFLSEAQKPYYLMFSIQVWLNVMLNLIVAITMILTMSLAMELRNGFSAGTLGLALTNISTISQTLSYVIQSWTEMETSVGALMRLKSFLNDTPSEHLPGEDNVPDGEWPSKGQLTFKGLTVKYSADSVAVLRDISLEVTPGMQIGVCGRTGSGKSSLILSILRMNDIVDGSITIDGQDLSLMPRDTIRRNIAVLPQDPVLLEGSLRFNLDPFGEHSDTEITSALADVDLGHLCETPDALDAALETDKLSAGQKQLLCIARALMSRSKFLMLDEATSAVDRETEDKIVKLVHEKFGGCTVIAVAHRLRTLLEFDWILVMEQGQIVEQGKPSDLLAQEDGRWRQLWDDQQ